jgi:hypothetical protein
MLTLTNPNSPILIIHQLVWFRLQGMRKDETSGFAMLTSNVEERCYGNLWWEMCLLLFVFMTTCQKEQLWIDIRNKTLAMAESCRQCWVVVCDPCSNKVDT